MFARVRLFNANNTACLCSLVFHAINAQHDDIDFAHPDTYDWLFNTTEFRDWRDPASFPNHNGVLWIKGKPSAGKSTLMKHAYLRYQNDFFRDHLIVSHFFNAQGETLEKTPLGMLRSIVYQLLQNDNALSDRFAPSLREKQRTSREGDWQWRPSELKGLIRSVVQQPRSRPLFLVDALDECDESEANVALPDLPLEPPLPKHPNEESPRIDGRKSPDHQNDIDKYIGEKLQLRDAEMEAEIKRRADGVFLWVVIVVSLLNKAYDEGRVEAMRKTLEEVPSSLEGIFNTILGKDVADMTETVLILQWVLLSRRPLKPLEVFDAVVKTSPPTIDLVQRTLTPQELLDVVVRKTPHTIDIDVVRRRIITASNGLVEIRTGNSDDLRDYKLITKGLNSGSYATGATGMDGYQQLPALALAEHRSIKSSRAVYRSSSIATTPPSFSFTSRRKRRQGPHGLPKLVSTIASDGSNFEPDRVQPLLESIIAAKPDKEIWGQVYQIIAEATSPSNDSPFSPTDPEVPKYNQLRELIGTSEIRRWCVERRAWSLSADSHQSGLTSMIMAMLGLVYSDSKYKERVEKLGVRSLVKLAGQTNVRDAAVPFDAVHAGLGSKRSRADASAESHPAERAIFQGRKANRDDSPDTRNAKMAKLGMCREEVLGELSNRVDQLRGEVWLELNTHMDQLEAVLRVELRDETHLGLPDDGFDLDEDAFELARKKFPCFAQHFSKP
ncbi:hypothetical protein PG993_010740 [Apiospora rasikravindrae]|uniref:Nephrocystin 3-like N-terminal domain-containing protein n=1 Tax=Apiospora rasikravindrae TaxID=990691 RepID=A0ABR1SC96_9PEZI